MIEKSLLANVTGVSCTCEIDLLPLEPFSRSSPMQMCRSL
uniref:Uncharacterized protein n=1 Tax=Arundo donax TaxID=35708 RepID=A0A0A9A756_ARUDO